MKKYQKIILIIAAVFASLLFLGMKEVSGNEVVIDRSEVITDNLAFGGSTFENNGTIDGNIYASGDKIIIDGTVKGNVFVAGNNIIISGKVEGDIYVAGNNITIEGEIGGNVFAAGNNVTLADGSTVSRDAYISGNRISVSGEILRSAYLGGSSIEVQGTVKGNLYYDAQKSDINESSVKGDIVKNESSSKIENTGKTVFSIIMKKLFAFASFVFTTLLIWGVITFVAKDSRDKFLVLVSKDKILKTSLLFGLLGMIVSFVIPIVLMITGLGFKLGIMTAILNSAFIYFSIGVAVVTLSGLIGKHKPNWSKGRNILILLILAVVIGLLKQIPFIAFMINVPLIILGYGLIIRSIVYRKDSKELKEEASIEN